MGNPLAGNSFASRADAAAAVRALVAPLIPHFSPGRGRVGLGAGAAHFHEAAAHLEGLARPLWGLAPLAAGGHDFANWGEFQAGLTAGSDPGHVDYWGTPAGRDQRIVESAAIGFAIALAPDTFWGGLPGRGRATLAAWLREAIEAESNHNNWMFFRVMVALGLDRVGEPYDRSAVEGSLVALERFDLGNGWYRDGRQRRADHYIGFAMHFYGLLYAALGRGDEARRQRFRERAAAFASDFREWFADDGASLPYGRSLTYRFAQAGFWGALAFAGVEGLPWGETRALWARHLRWWGKAPMADRDGVLPVGYAYPNLLMSEQYNSPGSPYWAMKAFLPLALPETHPFWSSSEAVPAGETKTVTQVEPGFVLMRQPEQVIALAGGQDGMAVRAGAEKYGKFAYSTRHAFSIESHPRVFETGAFDSMLAVSDDGRHFRIRDGETEARIGDGILYSCWSPAAGCDIETWLVARAPWHLRVHAITTERPLLVAEGGFAVRRSDAPPICDVDGSRAVVEIDGDLSAIVSLGDTIVRAGRVQKADPNTNLMWARTWVPQLRGALPVGTSVLMSAVLATPDVVTARAALAVPPPAPGLAELRARTRTLRVVPVFDIEP